MRFAPLHKAVLAASFCAVGLAAQAQPAPAAPPAGGAPMMGMHGWQGHGDPARMQERMHEHIQRRMDSLKRILQIAPAQEGAWNAWTNAMQPSMQLIQQRHAAHEELARMTTPERIDRMRQMRAQRIAEMDRRGEATKTLYAQLTPAQQKAFDEVSLRMLSHRHGGRGGHHGE